MLVLTRKQGEQIKIDGCIEVTVLSVQGHRVRIGIDAPHDVTVRRGELVFDLHTGREVEEEEVTLAGV
jgi:carbon storage regulator